MSKVKFLVIALMMVLTLSLVRNVSANVYVGNIENESVYTLSDSIYDDETGKLAYQKITYSKNTYTTMGSSDTDATGAPVDVSSDAQYVFFPARYVNMTSDTKVSFKFKNDGVKKIVMHAEYSAGVTKGGVDYEAGYKLVCMDVFNSWNASLGKSADGYDVFTVTFGLYAKEIYDVSFTGFRLYFDYGLQVTEERNFEVFGYEIHESETIPTFTSDPKPTRVGKLHSDDVIIENNTFTVDGTASVKAPILDSKAGYEFLAVTLRLKEDTKITFNLDGETMVSKMYEKGKYTVNLVLDGKAYNELEMIFEADNAIVIVQSFEFKGKPYLDNFSGSGYTFSVDGGVQTVKYTYSVGWYKISAPIREYNPEYSELHLEFELAQQTAVGIMIDDTYLYSHWSEDKLSAGKHSFVFDMTGVSITSSSALLIYLDPEVTSWSGTAGEKTAVFTKVEFAKPPVLPTPTVTVNNHFEFDYDGNGKVASGATSTSGSEVYYEYKPEGASDKYYDTTAPVNAGRYDVRAVSPRTDEYGIGYAYATLVINKSTAATPSSSVLTIDYVNSLVHYDETKYLVGSDETFSRVIPDGGYIVSGTKLYYKAIETKNSYESGVGSLQLTKELARPSVEINYSRERTLSVVSTDVEYSVDGVNWISGEGKVVALQPGNIYLFRFKATATSFASDITYVECPNRLDYDLEFGVSATDSSSITLKEIEGVEYKLDDTVWQTSNVFTGLREGSEVIVYFRVKGTSTTFASNYVRIKMIVGDLSSVEVLDNISNNPTVTPEGNEPEVVLPEDVIEVAVSGDAESTYVVNNYNELTAALKNTNNVTMTTIIINGTISLDYDITVKGKVTFLGNGNSVLAFENATAKRTIYNSADSDIRFENITLKRTITDNTEGFLFRFHSNGTATFTDVHFDVATLEVVNESFDRITYAMSGVELTLVFNNCTYDTEGVFYRGNMVFMNCESLPKTAGKAVVYDLSNLKLNYEKKVIKFPTNIKVSLDEDFTELVKTRSQILSNTTYYVTNGDITFSFTTKNLQLAKPTIENLGIDFANEKIYYSDKYVVALDEDLTQLVLNGDSVTPGMTLYVKRLGEGMYFDSEVAVITLPEKPVMPTLSVDYEGHIGFVMGYFLNAEYKIEGVTKWQTSPIFVGLDGSKTYTITMRIKATNSSFASETITVTVTTK